MALTPLTHSLPSLAENCQTSVVWLDFFGEGLLLLVVFQYSKSYHQDLFEHCEERVKNKNDATEEQDYFPSFWRCLFVSIGNPFIITLYIWLFVFMCNNSYEIFGFKASHLEFIKSDDHPGNVEVLKINPLIFTAFSTILYIAWLKLQVYIARSFRDTDTSLLLGKSLILKHDRNLLDVGWGLHSGPAFDLLRKIPRIISNILIKIVGYTTTLTCFAGMEMSALPILFTLFNAAAAVVLFIGFLRKLFKLARGDYDKKKASIWDLA